MLNVDHMLDMALEASYVLFQLILTRTVKDRNYQPHSTDEEIEARYVNQLRPFHLKLIAQVSQALKSFVTAA